MARLLIVLGYCQRRSILGHGGGYVYRTDVDEARPINSVSAKRC